MSLEATIQMFFEEAADLLRDFEEGLLRLERDGGDAEVVNRVFRSVHTLKGTAGMLGFEHIGGFTHVLEDVLMRVRKGQLAVTRPVIDTLLGSTDVLRMLVEAAKSGAAPETARVDETVAALRAHVGDAGPTAAPAPAASASAPAAAADAPTTVYAIRFLPPRDLLVRGLDPLRLADALAELGEVSELAPEAGALPALAEMDPESAYVGFRCRLQTTRPRQDVEAVFEFVPPGSVSIETVAPGGEPEKTGEWSGVERRERRDRRHDDRPGLDNSTIRVATAKVDRLINLVGELVVTQSMVAQLVTQFTLDGLGQLQEAVAQMDRHARDLQERVMAVRMLPVRIVFDRFPRVVRDLASARGKQVVLEMRGEDTELDKSVIEQIGDPLTHLVRNAVDHGLETPAARRAAGKPETGHLVLRAYQQGGNIYLEISDDGKGLDRTRLVAKAVEMELIAPDESLSDEEAYRLIFRPGLSTAERITEVSGRGVGMDVVARNVEALGGSIAIQSEPGRGTTFRVKLPLTLAILDGQALRVGDQLYILPITSILESIRPQAQDVHTMLGGAETISLRGQVLPMIRLHRLFGVTPSVDDPTRALVVIVEHESRKVALLVDELLGQQQVVIKSLETNFQRMEGIAGATILGDGHVALILDIAGLVTLARSPSRAGERARTVDVVPDRASGVPADRRRTEQRISGDGLPARTAGRRLAHRS
ncbi:MAG TPA: chemotaxis protein CheA [Methylomirabilota bacterium]|nr:chemotaxis protein CheA [Methylomirabilota bacterium]